MRLHVLVEVLLHVEVLAAPLAHELLVADVDAHVGAQLVLVLETLIAVLQGQDGDELLMSTQNTPHVPPQITSMSEQCRNHLFPPKRTQIYGFSGHTQPSLQAGWAWHGMQGPGAAGTDPGIGHFSS